MLSSWNSDGPVVGMLALTWDMSLVSFLTCTFCPETNGGGSFCAHDWGNNSSDKHNNRIFWYIQTSLIQSTATGCSVDLFCWIQAALSWNQTEIIMKSPDNDWYPWCVLSQLLIMSTALGKTPCFCTAFEPASLDSCWAACPAEPFRQWVEAPRKPRLCIMPSEHWQSRHLVNLPHCH